MKLRSVFLGKPVHWLPWPFIAGLYLWMNSVHLHVTRFNTFAFVILGIAAAVVAYVLFTTRRNELVTRDPIPQEGRPAGIGSED
jgi:hypothetical protein